MEVISASPNQENTQSEMRMHDGVTRNENWALMKVNEKGNDIDLATTVDNMAHTSFNSNGVDMKQI